VLNQIVIKGVFAARGAALTKIDCDLCNQVVKPFSNDQGDLICPIFARGPSHLSGLPLR